MKESLSPRRRPGIPPSVRPSPLAPEPTQAPARTAAPAPPARRCKKRVDTYNGSKIRASNRNGDWGQLYVHESETLLQKTRMETPTQELKNRDSGPYRSARDEGESGGGLLAEMSNVVLTTYICCFLRDSF